MSTVQTTPLLRSGMRLSSEEFLRRWYAMPDVKFAELIEGVVHMPSPLSNHHGTPNMRIATWLGTYQWQSPGTEGGSDLTCVMSNKSVPQPDQSLWIMAEYGGQSHIKDGLTIGAPELAIEVSYSSLSLDMGKKLKLYESAEVQEYLIVAIPKQEIYWHRLVDGKYKQIEPGEDGILRSVVFPGLWIDAEAFFQKDTIRLQAVLQAGLLSPEHAAFVEKLKQAYKE